MLKRVASLFCALALLTTMIFSGSTLVQAAEKTAVTVTISFRNTTAPERDKYAKAGDQIDMVFHVGEAKNADGSTATMTAFQFRVDYDETLLQPQETYFTMLEDFPTGWDSQSSDVNGVLNGYAFMNAINSVAWAWPGGDLFKLSFTVIEDGMDLQEITYGALDSSANMFVYGTQTDSIDADTTYQQGNTMYIDNQPPVLYLEDAVGSDGQTFDYYPIAVSAQDNSNDTVSIALDGEAVSGGAITEGGTLTAEDLAGNQSSLQVTINAETFDHVKEMLQALPEAEDATLETRDEIAAIDAEMEKLSVQARAKLDLTRYNEIKNVFASIEEDITAVEDMIANIGTVDYNSGETLAAIQAEIDRLAQVGVQTSEYENYAEYEAAQQDYQEIQDDVNAINEELAGLQNWAYTEKANYEALQTEMDAMEASYGVPESAWHVEGLQTLQEFIARCGEAETAMNAVKALIEALPEDATIADLAQINEASSAWDDLGDTYGLTDDQIIGYIGADMLEKLQNAESAVQDSLDRIQAVEDRIDALYTDDNIQYGVQDEIEALEQIMAGEATGGDALSAEEIAAVSADSVEKLQQARTLLDELLEEIAQLDEELGTFGQPAYADKDLYTAAREAMNSLYAEHGVPADETVYANIGNLLAAEAFIADTQEEIASVRETYAAIPDASSVKVTDEAALDALQARYDALLALGVTEEEIGADTARMTAAREAIQSLWEQAAALNEQMAALPETATWGDRAAVNAVTAALDELAGRGIEANSDNYSNYTRYESALQSIQTIENSIAGIENSIAALDPWKYGRSAQYEEILAKIAALELQGVTNEDISNYSLLTQFMELDQQAQAALESIVEDIKALPNPCTEDDKAAVEEIQTAMDALKAAPYGMTEDELKEALNAVAGEDVYSIFQAAMAVVNPEPEEPSEPSEPSDPSKPSDGKPSDGNQDTPTTGDSGLSMAVLATLVLSAGAFLGLKKRREV